MLRFLGLASNQPDLRSELSVLPRAVWQQVANKATGEPIAAPPHVLRLDEGETIVLGKVVRNGQGQLDLVLVQSDGTLAGLHRASGLLHPLGIEEIGGIRKGPIAWFSSEGENPLTLFGLQEAASSGARRAPVLWFRRLCHSAVIAV